MLFDFDPSGREKTKKNQKFGYMLNSVYGDYEFEVENP
jgi:hypothetical protein